MRPFVLNIYRPSGPSSASVVSLLKKYFPPKSYGKIGHLGTLDPFAEGVLLIALGGATKVANFVHRLLPKSYFARGVLGIKTDTGDLTGKVVQEKAVIPPPLTLESDLKERFEGTYHQSPPPFSASKYRGRPLYSYARKGKLIQKEAVARTIYHLADFKLDGINFEFNCTVSSGTYIRVLFEDMAKHLGTVGHLTKLIRTQIGPHRVSDSFTKELWPSLKQRKLAQMPLDKTLPLDTLQLTEEKAQVYRQGQSMGLQSQFLQPNPNRVDDKLIWVYGPNGILGLGERGEDGLIKVCFNLPGP